MVSNIENENVQKPSYNANETRYVSEKTIETLNDVVTAIKMYFPPRPDLPEIKEMLRDTFKLFVERCVMATIANIEDPEQKAAFLKNPAKDVMQVIRYAVETTDFDSSLKQELISRIDSLLPEDMEMIIPLVSKLRLAENVGPIPEFYRAASVKIREDEDLWNTAAILNMS